MTTQNLWDAAKTVLRGKFFVVVVAFVFSNTVINFSTFIISIDKFSNMNIKWSWSPYQTITRLGETAEGW